MRILFIGDIVGKSGRNAVRQLVPSLIREYGCDFCIANGENMAGGDGFTRQCLNELDDSGIDVFTSGDHIWGQKDFVKDIADYPYVLRPANFSPKQPGRGYGLFETASGKTVAVISLIGRTFIAVPSDCPFAAADRILDDIAGKTPIISGLRRVSKPGLRIYASCEEMPKVLKGLGIAIVSTSKGIMTDKQARKENVGGEVLAFIW